MGTSCLSRLNARRKQGDVIPHKGRGGDHDLGLHRAAGIAPFAIDRAGQSGLPILLRQNMLKISKKALYCRAFFPFNGSRRNRTCLEPRYSRGVLLRRNASLSVEPAISGPVSLRETDMFRHAMRSPRTIV